MKLLTLLIKLFVSPFYYRNTGFFLFFFFLFFGTVNAGSLVNYHLSLIQSILSSYSILTGVLVLWLLYNYKCTSFVHAMLQHEKGKFLSQLQTLPFKKQLVLFVLIQALLFLPILTYIGVVITIALQQGQVLKTVILLLFSLFVCFGSGLYYYKQLNSTWIFSKPLLLMSYMSSPKPRNFLFYLLHFSLQKKKRLLLVLKLLSLLIFYIALVWNRDSYDHDTLVLFLLIIILAHALLVFQYVQFIEKDLLFLRNLPLSPFQVFLSYYLTFTLLFLPEFIYLLVAGYALLPLPQVLAIYFTLVSTLMFFTTVQYSGRIDRNEFIKIAFGAGFVSIFFFNSEQYALWAGITFLCSALFFTTGYGQYEAEEGISE